ncbi:multicopper oxidase family protein [Gilliamella sp. B2923]|uniref:multicopper oxidase family protein n=1 Tax=unclassified Gilliamella TaxID=2685620 RepID=UPI001C6A6710|nr:MULTISPECIES: multicopper oxidase family protein [unclassified Gilliamella]MCX8617470.1 multicopper oxidase family protein [Gilliamella sp. B2923]QYN46161.1 multicopper oxidase family protein [Gilliamella sp. ESL0405]
MKRRNFIISFTAALGGLIATKAIAKMNHSSMSENVCDVKSDNCNTEGDMHDHMNMNMNMNMNNNMPQKLLSTTALPHGKNLPELTNLKNTSTQAGVFEATLHLKPVKIALTPEITTEFWAYNGMIPGPKIEVFEGDHVKITVKNDLSQPTTVHWHGLLIPSDQDGNPQDAIPAGGSRVYEFTIPEGTAGTYWYHPHGHNTVAEQVFRGLAGTFIVRSKNDPLASLPEQHWFFSDLKLTENGEIAENSMTDWMNGREGQFVLINGAYQPNIKVEGATRVRIWNACSGRYLNLSIPDCDVFLVATDGGFIAEPHQLNKPLLLTPAERAEVVIVPKKTASLYLQNIGYDRGKMGNVPPEQNIILSQLQLTQTASTVLPTHLKQVPTLGEAVAKKSLEYTEVMDKSEPRGGMLFLINGKRHDMSRIDLESKLHDVEEWTIVNNSHMDHNFHIHGAQFIVQSRELNGTKTTPEFVALKDTTNLRPHETLVIKIQQNMPGLRMYHCHIVEHETLGMMGQLMVK